MKKYMIFQNQNQKTNKNTGFSRNPLFKMLRRNQIFQHIPGRALKAVRCPD